MRILGLKKYRGRNPRGYFQDLPWEVGRRASDWLHRLMQKGRAERGIVPPWLFGIYVGQARRLALNPPTPAWGRSMLAKRGGYAVQRKYRVEDRVGPRHPARLAAKSRAKRQASIKEARKPGAVRHWFADLTGI
jgi:hypothetical protein